MTGNEGNGTRPRDFVAPAALSELLHGERPPLVLDVRRPDDYLGDSGHIEGACLFPMDRLAEAMGELSGLERRSFVLVCADGAQSAQAATSLSAAGFERVQVLQGGMRAWHDAGLAVRR